MKSNHWNAPPPRILVIESDPGFARTLQILLEDELGEGVVVAHDETHALHRLRGCSSLRLVLSELEMATSPTPSLLERARRERPDLAFVLMTAFPASHAAVSVRRLETAVCLGKPIDPGQLLAAARRLLPGSHPNQRRST